MTPEHITFAIKHARDIATDWQRETDIDLIERAPRAHMHEWDEAQVTAHVRWMANQALGFVAEERHEKAQRWLCFMQGALWVCGLASIDEFREANKPS